MLDHVVQRSGQTRRRHHRKAEHHVADLADHVDSEDPSHVVLGDRAEYPEKHGDSGRDNQQGCHDVAGLTNRKDQGESASHGVNADFGQ